jgi:hypothetical protein
MLGNAVRIGRLSESYLQELAKSTLAEIRVNREPAEAPLIVTGLGIH